MKLIIFFCFISLLLSCSKSSDPKSENDKEVDVSEGQTNWTKNEYWNLTKDRNYGNDFSSIGVNDIAIQGDTIVMVGSVALSETSARVWRSTDRGKTWAVIRGGRCGAGNDAFDVAFPSSNVIYALGNCLQNLRLYKSVDEEWSTIYLEDTPDSGYYNPMHFFDENVGIIGNIKTTDGGVTWTTIEDLKDYPSYQNNNGVIASNYFIDNQTGYCNSSSVIFKTINGGDNWSMVHSDSDASFMEIYFIDENVGFITTETELMKTIDGGQSWAPVLSETIRGISFATDEIGFAAGSGGIFKTTDKGETWSLNYSTNFITLEECCGDFYRVNGFNAIAFDGLALGISAGFQNRNFNPDKDKVESNLINEKAYIARTTTLGE